jgi:hypothetical protein
MKIQTQIWLGIIIVVLLISFFGYQYFKSQEIISTITVAGSSELFYKPDQAKVWAGVSILKPNAQDAQNEANKIIDTMLKSLNEKGITNNDIETDSINLYEDQTWTQSGSKSNGWRATQTLKIKTKDLSKVGTIVDIAVKSGANQINNIEFTLTPEKELEYKKKAIEEATKSARTKAEAMAIGSGAKLGKVKSLSESNFYYTPYNYAMKDNVGSAAVSESAQVMPRDVTVTANVNVVYEIN